MSAFENYGMAMLPAKTLRDTFNGLSASDSLVVQYSEIEVKGPAVQILPLMVFV
jgi:hypothetical protein